MTRLLRCLRGPLRSQFDLLCAFNALLLLSMHFQCVQDALATFSLCSQSVYISLTALALRVNIATCDLVTVNYILSASGIYDHTTPVTPARDHAGASTVT